jgi:undecaprenyl-diphosphatase
MLETISEWDRSVFFAINHGLHHPWFNPVMGFITYLGLGQVQLGILLGWTLFRLWIWDFGSRIEFLSPKSELRATKRTFFSGLCIFASSGIMVQMIKHLVNRSRPSNLPEAIVAPDERIFMNSFPSGHAATAFAFACFVWLHVRGTRWAWVGWCVWAMAGLVGLSRIYRGVHYPSDVLGGAIIGVLCCLGVWWLFNRSAHRQQLEPTPPAGSA